VAQLACFQLIRVSAKLAVPPVNNNLLDFKDRYLIIVKIKKLIFSNSIETILCIFNKIDELTIYWTRFCYCLIFPIAIVKTMSSEPQVMTTEAHPRLEPER